MMQSGVQEKAGREQAGGGSTVGQLEAISPLFKFTSGRNFLPI